MKMKRLFTFLTLMVCAIGMAWGATIGLTEPIGENNTLGAREFTGTTNVTIEKIVGANIRDFAGTSKTVYLDGTAYNSTDSWRKSQNGVYTDQYVGYTLTMAAGYGLNISKLNARIMVADDTYTWYVEILDNNNTAVYTSTEKTTKKASTASIADDLTLTGLTGTVTVKLWVKQGGSTKYYSIDQLTLEAEAVADTRPTYTITTSITPAGAGTITPSGITECPEGEDVVLTATNNTGYKFVKWTVDDNDYTTNPYTIANVSAPHTAVATFEALPKITFSDGEDADIKGTLPSIDYAEAGTQYTIPTAYFLVKEGHTLTGWTDGENTYPVGSQLTITGDVTLTAVFTPNTAALGTAATTVNWAFAPNAGAPTIVCENNTMYYVKKATVGGKELDAIMFIDTRDNAGISGKRGKINNSGQTERAQVNAGTVFIIPAIKNMLVKYVYTNGTPGVDAATFNGENADEVDAATKTIKYTYSGDEATLTIIDQGANLYPSGIYVEYPQQTITASVTADGKGLATFCSDKALDFSGVENFAAYTATVEGTTVTFTKVDKAPANTGLLIRNTAGETAADFTIPVIADGGTISSNVLVGTMTEINIASGYVLNNVAGVVGFYKANDTKVAAGKAYLNVSSGAKMLGFNFNDGAATGISEIKNAGTAEGVYYNLNGMRVEKPAKGLYILNGKKVIK
jgi:hypothetical protein